MNVIKKSGALIVLKELSGMFGCRSRIKLVEREQGHGLGDGRCQPVPLLNDEPLAVQTVRELVDAGLRDDAMSLALAYRMDVLSLAALLTLACLDATDPALQVHGQSVSMLGPETRASQDRQNSDAWSALQVG